MPAIQFPVIEPLVTRHAEDAAFYWAQLDGAIRSPTLRPDRLRQFDSLLDAHLDGLVVAGPNGWKPAMGALARWKKPGEAFVCTWLAVRSNASERLDDVLAVAHASPQNVLRGAISALAWLPTGGSLPVIRRWGAPDASPIAQVTALRAAALMGPEAIASLDGPLTGFLASPDHHVRSAACRAAAHDRSGATLAALRDGLTDPELAVRAEAAITLGRADDCQRALPVLLRCVVEQAKVHADASGWNRMQASRRLDRWTRELAWLVPFRKADTASILAALPPRAALTFVLAHGDAAHLPFVAGMANDLSVSRYAGWVWQSLTGIDLAAAGLARPEQLPASLGRETLITEARLDADNGLPEPDGAALQRHSLPQDHEAPVLLGRVLDVAHAVNVMQTGPQALRFLAARRLEAARLGVRITVRGPVPAQSLALERLQTIAPGSGQR